MKSPYEKITCKCDLYENQETILRSPKNLDFCIKVIKGILKTSPEKFDSVYIGSIQNYIAGFTAVKIHNEFPKHNKEDLKILLQLLANSILNRNHFGKDTCNSIVWQSLNKVKLNEDKASLYNNLLNFTSNIFIEKKK